MTQHEPSTPYDVAVSRVVELRKRLGWSARRLGEEMASAGFDWSRETVTNFELRRRRASVNELFGLAYVLNVSLTNLLVPVNPLSHPHAGEMDDKAPYQVVPKLDVPIWQVRQWIRGWRSLPGQDPYRYFAEAPEHERPSEEELSRLAKADPDA